MAKQQQRPKTTESDQVGEFQAFWRHFLIDCKWHAEFVVLFLMLNVCLLLIGRLAFSSKSLADWSLALIQGKETFFFWLYAAVSVLVLAFFAIVEYLKRNNVEGIPENGGFYGILMVIPVNLLLSAFIVRLAGIFIALLLNTIKKNGAHNASGLDLTPISPSNSFALEIVIYQMFLLLIDSAGVYSSFAAAWSSFNEHIRIKRNDRRREGRRAEFIPATDIADNVEFQIKLDSFPVQALLTKRDIGYASVSGLMFDGNNIDAEHLRRVRQSLQAGKKIRVQVVVDPDEKLERLARMRFRCRHWHPARKYACQLYLCPGLHSSNFAYIDANQSLDTERWVFRFDPKSKAGIYCKRRMKYYSRISLLDRTDKDDRPRLGK